MTPNQLVIVDEADDLLYKQPSAFFNLGANRMRKNPNTNPKIICLTATKGFQTPLWKSLLKNCNYSEFEYWPKEAPVPSGVIKSLNESTCSKIAPENLHSLLR